MDIITFDEVYKEFSDGDGVIRALKKTSFTIQEGELVAVIGPSGSGKSTLLTLMGGLQVPTGGQIKFMGKDFSSMSMDEKNKLRFDQIGFILQSSNLIPFLKLKDQFKLLDKISNTDDKKRAHKIMKDMDILKRKNLYPKELSGGERQRASIARAIYNEPKLILADEPTANLDTEKALDVIRLLKNLMSDKKRSIVLVTHDERLLAYCDRVFKIVDGKLNEID